MPVAPGRNIAILVEVAARNQLLRARGHHAARMLAERLEQTLRRAAGRRRPTDEDDEDDRATEARRPDGGASPTRRRIGRASQGRQAPQRSRAAVHRPDRPVGIGKSQAIRALEDLGYFCVDNLPTTLIPTLAKLSLRGGDIEKVAIVVDVREGNFLSSFPKIFRRLRKMRGLNPVLIFLEASNAALVRRFSETRRPHPLAPGPVGERGDPRRAGADDGDPRDGRRDRRHVGHDRPRAAAVLHGAVARPRRARGWS